MNGAHIFFLLIPLFGITSQDIFKNEDTFNATKNNDTSSFFQMVYQVDATVSLRHHISKRGLGTVLLGVAKFFCFFFCRGKKATPPNNPPSFSFCDGPGSEEYFADINATTANVNWKIPTATDPEDGIVSVSLIQGGIPGTLFDRGSHTVVYSASDKMGATSYCYFTFRIKVLTCDPIQWPSNGIVHCEKSEFLYGSKCTVRCLEGYEMQPQPSSIPYQIMCNKSTDNVPTLDKDVPTCQAITCPANTTELDIDNGSPLCTNNMHKYDSSCVTHCNSGYSMSSGIIFTTCQEDKTWSNHLPDCEDSEPPEILNCPITINTYTDKMSKTAVVTWSQPTAMDNSGQANVSQTKGLGPGSTFQKGLTEIRYVALDANGNKSPECVFFINVEEISCDPPLILDKYLIYQCPEGYSYGSMCHLKCMGNFSLIGNDSIRCERNDSFTPPHGYWDMEERQPYCLKNPCDVLQAPENGAMSCATWLFGMQCQMQCSSQYDIPYGTVGSNGTLFTGIFTCSESLGEYLPSNTVPGCTQLRRPRMTTVLGEFFYYTGDCNDPTVLVQIKNNFINLMQRLESQGWNGVCPSQIDCNVNNTEVTCGSVNGKRKRDVNLEKIRTKRNSHEIRVEITLLTTWYDFNTTGGSTFFFLEDVQKNVFDTIKNLATAGNLTVRGLSPDVSSFALGYSDPDCPEGTTIRWSSLTCVPCSKGTYLDITDALNPKCRNCPLGTYKDNPEDQICFPCPQGTSTTNTGSINVTSCLNKCSPGKFSKTGLEPCHVCPRSFFQSDDMSTSCMPCPFGKTTAYSGATSISNCSNFDVRFTGAGQEIVFISPTTDQTTLSLYTWIFLPTDFANMSLFKTQSLSTNIEFRYFDSLIVFMNSQALYTNVTLLRETWSHIVIQLDSSNQTVIVFLDGSKVYSASIASSLSYASALVTSMSPMSIILFEESLSGGFLHVYETYKELVSYKISGYHVDFTALSDVEVVTFSNGCHIIKQSAYISMDTIAKNLSQEHPIVSIVSPSVCDNINQCDPNPCNGHPCVDKVNEFKCKCKDGYTGDLCQIEPDYCNTSPCKNNATCTNSGGNFSCSCITGYKGGECQIQLVNGGWSQWTSFSECSASCGGGMKSRSRLCNSPKPDPDGLPCDPSDGTEAVVCNAENCPSCPRLRKGFGNKENCTTVPDGHISCVLSCRSGYAFSSGNQPLLAYMCGPNTSYAWNGRPPSCGRANSPGRISIISSIQYSPEVFCDDAADASSKLKANLELALPCFVNGSCSVNVTTQDCSVDGRRRRSISSQIITLTQTLVSGDILDLDAFEESQSVSQPLMDLLMGVSSLEASAIQINTTHSILQFEISGTQYTSIAVTTETIVECLDGQERNEILCIECPPGTHLQTGVCIPCSIGTYQDETGQSSCKSCPEGLATEFEGSQNITDCSVETNLTSSTVEATVSSLNKTVTENPQIEEVDEDLLLFIAVGSGLFSIVVVATGCSVHCYKNFKKAQFRSLNETRTCKGSWASLSMVQPLGVQSVAPTWHVYRKRPRNSKSDVFSMEEL